MVRRVQVLLVALAFLSCGAQDGGWLKTYPPWNEPGTPTYNAPEVWFPVLGPFTRHSCFPSRYMSMRIAASHINRRDSTYCPGIGQLRNNFQVSYEHFDTNANGVGAVEALLTPTLKLGNRTKVVLGPNSSGSSRSAANLLTVFGIPNLSWAATSSTLSDKFGYPYFSRVVAPDSVAMKGLADFVSVFIGKKVNILFSDTAFSSGQATDFRDAAVNTFLLEVESFSFPNSGSGGAAITDANMEVVVQRLQSIKATLCRVVVASAINEEAWDLVRTAYDLGMVNALGWIWLGGDGFSGGQFGDGDLSRTAYFSGFVFVAVSAQGENFPAFSDRWAQEMPSTETPEFFEQPICSGGVICSDHPEHNNFNESGQREALNCRGYTPLAYDAMVFIAKVADLLIGDPASPKHPDSLTAEDWANGFLEMQKQENGFECLSGFVVLDEDHDRKMGMTYFNLQNGSLGIHKVASWSPATNFTWAVGATLMWTSGWTGEIVSPDAPPFIPTGAPPICDIGYHLVNDVCEECASGFYSLGEVGVPCQPCEAGSFQELRGQSACSECQPGTVAQEGSSFCTDCEAGFSTLGRPGEPECTPCNPGQLQQLTGQPYCEDCEAGRTSQEASSSCFNCSAGSSTSGEAGAGSCTPCSVGTYADAEGEAACRFCPVGRYAETPGTTACERCGDGALWSTMQVVIGSTGEEEWVPFQGASNSSSCGCGPGSRPGGTGCVRCEEGMTCPGMGEVIIEQGYYSGVVLSIFRCFGDLGTERCPGGPPGDACAEGREGITCTNCMAGKIEARAGTCEDCGDADQLPMIVAAIVSCIFACFIYHFIDSADRSKQAHSTLVVAMIFGQILTITQQLSVVGTMAIDWAEPILTVMRVVQLFAFNIELLRLNCVASVSPVSRFTSKTLLILVALVVMFFIHIGFSYIKYREGFLTRWPALVGVVGALFTAFYTAIVSAVMGPFQCIQHPNGMATLRSYMSVLCWEDSDPDHNAMMAIGVCAMTLPLGFLCWCIYVVKIFPQRIREQDALFMKTYAFLFFRFTTAAYWYCLVVIFRGLLIALAPSIPTVAGQLIALQIVVTISLIITIHFKPWRVLWANIIDALFSVGMAMMLSLSGFIVPETVSRDSVSWFTAGALLASIGTAPFVIIWALWCRFGRRVKPYRFFLCHHKATAGCFCRLMKMVLLESPALHRRKVFIDADDLQNLDGLFDIVRTQVETLLAISSKTLLSRPWCVGEIATAKASEVAVMPILFVDYEPPSEEFLVNYSKYVPDLHALTESGFTLEVIVAAMRWVAALPGVKLTPRMALSNYVNLSSELISGNQARRNSNNTSPRPGMMGSSLSAVQGASNRKILVAVDRDHSEAFATAHILIKMLAPIAITDSNLLPALFPEDCQVPQGKWTICICMNGCLQSPMFIRELLVAWEGEMGLLPAVAEDHFHFPNKEQLKELAVNDLLREANAEKQVFSTYDIMSAISCLFKEIAVFFLPLGADSVLQVRSTDIQRRVVVAQANGSHRTSTAVIWSKEC